MNITITKVHFNSNNKKNRIPVQPCMDSEMLLESNIIAYELILLLCGIICYFCVIKMKIVTLCKDSIALIYDFAKNLAKIRQNLSFA